MTRLVLRTRWLVAFCLLFLGGVFFGHPGSALAVVANTFDAMAAVPELVDTGAAMIRNVADDNIYLLQGRNNTGFYKYSLSTDSWTTLTDVPAAVTTGSAMIRNAASNDIYVLVGGGPNFYKYSISGNSWTTLTVAPGTITAGSAMIRNGADNDIYVLKGAGQGFYKYSVSGNSWTTLTDVPQDVASGATMIRNGSDNDIYVQQGIAGTHFYKYSIAGNSWSTLTSVPVTVSGGSAMIRNSSDNDIYLLAGNNGTSFYKYSISGNSWSSLTSVPSAANDGSTMIRNSSANDIYVLATGAAAHFYKYSISGNSWTTLTDVPGTVGAGGAMLRHGGDNQIYILQSSGTDNLWRYNLTTTVGALSCTTRTSACNAGEVEIYEMESLSNSHAGLPAAGYSHLVCCTGITGLGNSCSGTYARVLRLSGTTDAHVRRAAGASYPSGTDACISVPSGGSVSIGYQATNCTGFDTALGSMIGFTNSHVGDISWAAGTTKICATAAPPGTLSVDIIDAGGSSVASPSLTMQPKNLSFDFQTSFGTFGQATQIIKVLNTTTNPEWTLTIAADSGPTSVWSAGTPKYDFNDPTGSAGDGGDADTYGGKMSMDPTVEVFGGSCATTGLTKGSIAAFSEGVTDSITLVTAGSTADTGCSLAVVNVTVAQTIPGEQAASSYTIPLTLTIMAD